MKPWDRRPIEVRNLFNPAFCGLILFRSMSGYEEENIDGMPFSLSLLVLPLCLYKSSRLLIADSPRSPLLKIIEKKPEILVGFADRAADLLPYTLEALGFLMQRCCFVVSSEGRLKIVRDKVRKSVRGTEESVACQRTARFIGKEFARISDRVTIYTTLGVQP